MKRRRSRLLSLIAGLLLAAIPPAMAQPKAAPDGGAARQAEALKRDFFAVIEHGDPSKLLSYVPATGVNVGPQAKHLSPADVEQQLLQHRGLYCQLFDSSCIQSGIKLDASTRACSYRELLTHSEKVRTAATETVRSGVRQAILVAEIKNAQCPAARLVDFIFNFEDGGWKLFSVP
jgi:hypothetical protein